MNMDQGLVIAGSRALAVLGLLCASLTGCGPPPPPTSLDTGLYRSGVPHAMSLSTAGTSTALFARDGFSARVTQLDLKGYEYSFDFEIRDPAARVWRGHCFERWEIHGGVYNMGHPGFTDLDCGARLGDGNATLEHGEARLELRSVGTDARALKDWNGRARGGYRPAGQPGVRAVDRDTFDLEVRGNGAVLTAQADGLTGALLQVSPEPGMWVAPGIGNAAATPGLFFLEAALVLARAVLPPEAPAALLKYR